MYGWVWLGSVAQGGGISSAELAVVRWHWAETKTFSAMGGWGGLEVCLNMSPFLGLLRNVINEQPDSCGSLLQTRFLLVPEASE